FSLNRNLSLGRLAAVLPIPLLGWGLGLGWGSIDGERGPAYRSSSQGQVEVGSPLNLERRLHPLCLDLHWRVMALPLPRSLDITWRERTWMENISPPQPKWHQATPC